MISAGNAVEGAAAEGAGAARVARVDFARRGRRAQQALPAPQAKAPAPHALTPPRRRG